MPALHELEDPGRLRRGRLAPVRQRRGCARAATPDLILGCGDLPAYYLDYLVSKLDVPLYAIHGNHDAPPPLEGLGGLRALRRALDRRPRACDAGGLAAGRLRRLAALQHGRLPVHAGRDARRRAQPGAAAAAERSALRPLPGRADHPRAAARHSRRARPCHTGFDAFHWLVRTFQPRYHLHGHIHLYDRRTPTVTRVGATDVINVYPFRELTLDCPSTASLSLDELRSERRAASPGPAPRRRATPPGARSGRLSGRLGTPRSAGARGSSATADETLRRTSAAPRAAGRPGPAPGGSARSRPAGSR